MIKLWNDAPYYSSEIGQPEPSLVPYLTEKYAPCVIVCPGGGYAFKAEHEGRPIAEWLNSVGYNAFVLDYRVSPYRQPVPLLDLQRAVRFVRFHSDEYKIPGNGIGVLGFSAGGHLAASSAVFFDNGRSGGDSVDGVSCRPDFAVLCYPVIDMSGDFGHEGSTDNLLGENASDELKEKYSLQKQVKADTPPVFLWHTSDDGSVPVRNSLAFADALSEKKILFALNIFPHGHHGLGLAPKTPDVSKWTYMCEIWLNQLFDKGGNKV